MKNSTGVVMAATMAACAMQAAAQEAELAASAAAPVAAEAAAESSQASYAPIPVQAPAVETEPLKRGDAESRGIEEVLVTARRTSENMQDVPVAVTALSAADLQREKVASPQDLQGRVPSLTIQAQGQSRNIESPNIRGQGGAFGASPGVVIYFGQVPMPADVVTNNQGGPGKFFDLGNLQVLKGSQGTLFGRNTTGGALVLEPVKPQPEPSASLRAGVSNYGGQSYEAIFNQPLIEDTLLMRAGAQYFTRDGFTRDVVNGQDYDSKHYWTVRGSLIWRPTERIENYLLGYYTNSDDNGTGTVIQQFNQEEFNEFLFAGLGPGALAALVAQLPDTTPLGVGCTLFLVYARSPNCGQDILDEQAARGNRRVSLSADPTDQIKVSSVINNFGYDLSDEATLRYIASYSRFYHHYRLDIDGSRVEFVDFNNADDLPSGEVDTFTSELQLQGTTLDSALKYVAGVYYETTDASGAIHGDQLLFTHSEASYTQKKASIAPFAQGTYDLGAFSEALSGLSLTAGARYTFDETEGEGAFALFIVPPNTSGSTPGITTSDLQHAAATKSEALTYTVGLDYKFDANLLYGKVSRGYKTGGFSTLAVNPAFFTYDPEYVINYEIGQKSDFELFGMPVRLNSALYYTDYRDLQRVITDSYVDPNAPSPLPQIGATIVNVGQAYVAGFEADATIRVTQGFTFLGTYSYGKGKIKEYEIPFGGVSSQRDCSGRLRSRGQTLELSCIPYEIPKHTFSVSGRYLLPLDPSYGDIEASATYSYLTSRYTSPTSVPGDEPGALLPAVGLLNASVGWSRIFGSNFDLQLYGTNLTDKEVPIVNSNQWHLTYLQAYIYSEPRIYGLNLSYDWGR